MALSQYETERWLAWCYPLLILFSFIGAICTAVAWNHWKMVLDTCVDWNCGCFLYGSSTPTYYIGGHIAYCHWSVYGLIIPMAFAIIFGTFHVFRVCIGNVGRPRRGVASVRQKSGDVLVMTARTEVTEDSYGISPNYWAVTAAVGFIMFLYQLVHASIYTDGFYRSCRQYRVELIKYMQAGGPMVAAIQGRLSCAATFDFMDYLHPDVSFERRRIDRINTPACAVIALITTWLSVGLWIAIFVLNTIQSRATRRVRV